MNFETFFAALALRAVQVWLVMLAFGTAHLEIHEAIPAAGYTAFFGPVMLILWVLDLNQGIRDL